MGCQVIPWATFRDWGNVLCLRVCGVFVRGPPCIENEAECINRVGLHVDCGYGRTRTRKMPRETASWIWNLREVGGSSEGYSAVCGTLCMGLNRFEVGILCSVYHTVNLEDLDMESSTSQQRIAGKGDIAPRTNGGIEQRSIDYAVSSTLYQPCLSTW
jgi:hypothetical protein